MNAKIASMALRGVIDLTKETSFQKKHPVFGIMTIYPNYRLYLLHRYNKNYRWY